VFPSADIFENTQRHEYVEVHTLLLPIFRAVNKYYCRDFVGD